MKITGTLIEMGDLDGEGPGIRIETAAGVVTITGLGEGLLRDEPGNLLYARVQLSVEVMAKYCECRDRLASQCPGAWEPGCDLGANEAHVVIAPAEDRDAVQARADWPSDFPEQIFVSPEMVQEAIAHAPFDIGRGMLFFCWMADRLNTAIAHAGSVCPCCGVTADGIPSCGCIEESTAEEPGLSEDLPPDCTGDAASCPENEGYGCCKPNRAPAEDPEHAARAERWAKAPEWANWLCQTEAGLCFWLSLEPRKNEWEGWRSGPNFGQIEQAQDGMLGGYRREPRPGVDG